MPANLIWRGCLWAYLSGIGMFAIGLGAMFLIDLIGEHPAALSDVPIIVGSFFLFVGFAAVYGAVLAAPLAAFAFAVNAAFRPSPANIPWWLSPLVLAATIILITGTLEWSIAGVIVGWFFWRGVQRT